MGVTSGVLCCCGWRLLTPGAVCARAPWLPGSKAPTLGYFSAIWKRCLLPPFLPLCFHLLQGHMSQAGTTPAPNKGPWSAQLGAGAMQDPGSLCVCNTPTVCMGQYSIRAGDAEAQSASTRHLYKCTGACWGGRSCCKSLIPIAPHAPQMSLQLLLAPM